MKPTIIYYDVLGGGIYDASGSVYAGSRNLSVFLDNKISLEIHYVTIPNGTTGDPASWTPWTGLEGLSVASSIAVDNNWVHASKGTLDSTVTTESTEVVVTASSIAINKTGNIIFILNDGTRTSVAYTAVSYSGGKYTFTITNDLLSSIPAGTSVRIPEALIMKAEGASIDDTQAPTGVFTVELYALSEKLLDLLDYSSTASVSTQVQHKIVSEGNVIHTFNFSLMIANLLDFNNDVSIVNQDTSTQASKAWVYSLFRQGMLVQFSENMTEWHDTQTTSDKYFRFRIDSAGAWGEAVQLLEGKQGLSAYEVWLSDGNSGTVDDFFEDYRGTGYTYKGAYVSGAVYNKTSEYIDLVEYNGSTWAYNGTVSGSGNPPPALPDTSNDYWVLMARKGDSGETGAVYTPSVNSEGILSWTNDGSLPNPTSVNIKGPKGDAGVKIEGNYTDITASDVSDGYILVSDDTAPVAVEINNVLYSISSNMEHDTVNSKFKIPVSYLLTAANVASITDTWRIWLAGGSKDYIIGNPMVEFTAAVSGVGRCVMLDSTTPKMVFVDNVWDITNIGMQLITANPDVTGNVVLVPIVNGISGSTYVLPVGATPTVSNIPIEANGTLIIERDVNNTLDTVKDDEIVTIYVINVEFTVKH